jgi:hypothetical protein
MKTHPSVAETGRFNFPLRGIIENVYHKDAPGNTAKQTVVDIALLDGFPPLSKVPLLTSYTTKENGEEWSPEKGAYVMVQFIAGQWRVPVVTGFLPVPDNDIQAATADAPRMHRKRNGIDEVYDKDGNRRIKVAASDFLDVVTDLLVTVINGVTTFISKGKTTIQSQGTVEIDGIGTGAVKGCRQGDSICAYTGKPVIMVSATVKASK